jgi:hypothetical protein
MSFPKDNSRRVGKPPAATVDERQSSLNPLVRIRAAHYSKNKPDESRTGRPAFAEDFLLEHSRFDQQADSIVLASCF